MTRKQLRDKIERMLDQMLIAYMIPKRVRLGAQAFELAGPKFVVSWDLEVLADPQLLPLEVVLDAEDREGGFDEFLLVILEGRANEIADRMAANDRSDNPWPNVRCKGNRPEYKGKS